jgi:hypothetical protein
MRVLLKLVATLLLAATMTSHAGESVPALTNPRVIPDPAIAGQPVSLRLRWNGCGGYSEPVVQVSGTVVTVSQTYFEICGVPPPGHDVDFAIGSFPAGSYTLTYISQSDGAPDADPSINVPFVVTGAALTFGAPTLGGVAEGLLGLALLLLAWCARRRPKSSSE